MQEPSIFTKIINGDIPAHKVYEDDRVIAFLDISPITAGHTLVVPKVQVDSLWDLSPTDYEYLMQIIHRVADRQNDVLRPARVAMTLDGFAVPHAHIHVFPVEKGLDATMIEHARRPMADPDHAALAAMAEKLHFS
jgi:histidine triad (HIT) family protein